MEEMLIKLTRLGILNRGSLQSWGAQLDDGLYFVITHDIVENDQVGFHVHDFNLGRLQNHVRMIVVEVLAVELLSEKRFGDRFSAAESFVGESFISERVLTFDFCVDWRFLRIAATSCRFVLCELAQVVSANNANSA